MLVPLYLLFVLSLLPGGEPPFEIEGPEDCPPDNTDCCELVEPSNIAYVDDYVENCLPVDT